MGSTSGTASSSSNLFRFPVLMLVLGLALSATGTAAPDLAELPVVSVESTVFGRGELVRVEKALGIAIGHRIDPARLDEGIQSLYQQGRLQSLFVDAIPEGRGIHINLRGSRIRKLRRIQFTGIEPDVLDEVRRKLNFEEGEFTDTRTFTTLKDRIKAAYASRGYPFAEVQVLVNDVPDSQDADVEVAVRRGDPTVISKLVVTGASPDEDAQLRSLVPLRKGDRFAKPVLDEAIEKITRYLRSNQYPTAKVVDTAIVFSPDKRSVEINLMVKLGQRYQFEFSGNKVFDDLTLRDLLTEEILSQADAVQRIVEMIQSKYRAVGYHFCTVDAKSSIDEKDGLTVVRFVIEEGNKVLIDRTEFSGGESLGNGRLEGMFYGDAPGVLARHIYWEEGVQPAMQSLQKKLETMGYLSASVSGPRTIFSDDKKGVQLFFDLDLGIQTRVGAVELEGNTHVDRKRLESLYAFRPGEPLSRDQVEDTRKKIQAYYTSQGYADMRFSESDANDSIAMGKEQRQATLRFHIIEGPQYRVGKVSLEGNRKTRPEVILREMKLKRGDKFDPALVRRSEEDISFLGLFSRVEIVPSTNPAEPNQKDLKVVVRETRPGVGELGLGGYYEDPYLRLKGFGGVAYRNLWGLNQTVSARAEGALPLSLNSPPLIPFIEYGGLLGYRAPYPFELPFNFITEVGVDRHETSTSELTVQTSARIEERIEHKFSKNFTGLYRLHHYERAHIEKLQPAAGDNTPDTVETIGSTGPGIILDFRNDIFNPTQGSFHTLDLEFAHTLLGSQSADSGHSRIAFYEIISRNSFYLPLFGPFSFSFFAGGGYAKSLYGDPLPQARLLYNLSLGGQGSIRGFSFNRFVPDSTTAEAGYYNFRAEFTTQLFANISGAIFFDTGQLFHSALYPDRHDGVGIGFRYKTPVGPVVIDVAQGLGPDKESVKFYFTVGTF